MTFVHEPDNSCIVVTLMVIEQDEKRSIGVVRWRHVNKELKMLKRLWW